MATTSDLRGSLTKPVKRGLLKSLRETLGNLGVTGLGLLAVAVFLLPLGYVLSTSLKLDFADDHTGSAIVAGRAVDLQLPG